MMLGEGDITPHDPSTVALSARELAIDPSTQGRPRTASENS